MDITQNVPFHKLNDKQKIEVCLAIFEKNGLDISKKLFTIKVTYLEELPESEVQDILKTYIEVGDFEKAAYIRDFMKKRKEKTDAGKESN